MSYSIDLLSSGQKLLGGVRGRPRRSDCNRAVSTAYYAVFDCLCRGIANRIVGQIPRGTPASKVWVKVFRSLNHEHAGSTLGHTLLPEAQSGAELQGFATRFNKLKNARHEADYNPSRHFNKDEAQALLDEARTAIELFQSIPKDDFAKLIVALVVNTRSR